MRRSVATVVMATAFGAATPAWCETGTGGAYVGLALGPAFYERDCSGCGTQRTAAGKLSAGYRFGVGGIEATLTQYGGSARDMGTDYHRRRRSLGLGATWTWPLGDTVQAVARVGGADVRTEHVNGTQARWIEGTGGLGLLFDWNGAAAFELGWDVSVSFGGRATHALLAGVRWRF